MKRKIGRLKCLSRKEPFLTLLASVLTQCYIMIMHVLRLMDVGWTGFFVLSLHHVSCIVFVI